MMTTFMKALLHIRHCLKISSYTLFHSNPLQNSKRTILLSKLKGKETKAPRNYITDARSHRSFPSPALSFTYLSIGYFPSIIKYAPISLILTTNPAQRLHLRCIPSHSQVTKKMST